MLADKEGFPATDTIRLKNKSGTMVRLELIGTIIERDQISDFNHVQEASGLMLFLASLSHV